MNELPLPTPPHPRRSSRDTGRPREGSPVGMLEGLSGSAPRQGIRSRKTSASTSSSCHFTPQHLIFGLSRAGAGPGAPTALQRRTSRESAGTPVRRGPTTAGERRRAKCAQRHGGRQAERRAGGRERAARRRGGAGAPRRRGPLIGSPRGRRQGGPHPGYWPPADPPRRCGRLRSPSPAPRLGLFAQLRPI